MLSPFLGTWIEQRNDFPAERIVGRRLVALVEIAHGTGQPEVLFYGGSAAGLWEEVIDLHRHADYRNRCETVTTSVAGLCGDSLA